uniref:separase n=1 Tax=Hucho hucho TaxID=62062 RepID=A0A4W5M5H5_9TELE
MSRVHLAVLLLQFQLFCLFYEHFKILSMFCYNLHPAQPEEDWPPLTAWFLSRFLPRNGPGPQGRTLYDRVIRACNHQLGVGNPDSDQIAGLIKLVELALRGYDISGELGVQSTPLYMEKITFHILKKLGSLGVYHPCSYLGSLLYQRLAPAPQTEDYCVLVRSCFAVLWNGLSAAQDGACLNPRDKLRCQMQALSFLLLLDRERTSPPSCSKTPIYMEDALAEFEKGCGTLTKDDASLILEETHRHLLSPWAGGRGGDGQPSGRPCLSTLCEVVLITSKHLSKAGFWSLAAVLVGGALGKVRNSTDGLSQALVLGRLAVDIHRSMSSGEESGQAFTECARTLRSLPNTLGTREAHVILEGCSLVVWAVEAGQSKGLSGAVLLAWFSFLEEHQELMQKRLQKVSVIHSSLTRKNIKECLLTAVSNLVCGLYNRRLYDQAFTLVEILCQELRKNCPPSLSVDRLSRAFMLAVQSSRRGSHLERALDWVILWLQTLGPGERLTQHMTEPVSLWVRIKADAARAGQEDTRLRTLRDGFGPDVPDEGVMLCLLEEELRAYREVAGDSTQERYNTLCDLLDICHEDSYHSHLRAVYLCEMAQVVCFQDFSEQTDCSAVDFTHEALRLLEEEPETEENADRLKDDKAHASLWLYVCTLEKNLQEVAQGVPYLCEVLKEVGEQRHSKSWYLLRARALQTSSAYLSLDTAALPPALRQRITQHGLKTPDTALYESLKLLCSLLVTLVGNGLLSSLILDPLLLGDNLVLKWQLLSELLGCSVRMVSVRSSSGAVHEAKLQCLEALKLATKLQTLSQCAELLVIKAELELMKGEREECGFDLDKVRNLLELCTGTLLTYSNDCLKGRPAPKSESPLPSGEEDCKTFLSTRWFPKEPIERDLASSPPLKARAQRWLSSLDHVADCQCPCCSEPSLGRVTARWATTQADLALQLSPTEVRVSRNLHLAALARCKSITVKMATKLTKLFPLKTLSPKPCLLQDLVARVYLRIAMSGLELRLGKAAGTWKVLEAGLAFVDSKPSPELGPLRARLLVAKAQVSCLALATQRDCPPEELFSAAWAWNPPPKGVVEVDHKPKTLPPPPTSLKKSKDPVVTASKAKDTKKTKDHIPKIKFSDESDTESNPKVELKEKPVVSKKCITSTRALRAPKPVSDPPAEKAPPKRASVSSSSQSAPARRGRPRRQQPGAGGHSEAPERMRTIEEEMNGFNMDSSVEELRASDTETEETGVASKRTFHVACILHRLELPSHAVDGLSVEAVQALLRSAWLALQHFPPPTLYPRLCGLLALSLGQRDSVTTAMLHVQSLGVTSRHHMTRKLKKSSSELADRLGSLSLEEPSSQTGNPIEQRLSQLEKIFSFPTAEPSVFPQQHCQQFITQLDVVILSVPSLGVTVCVLSVLGMHPGEMGDTVLLSRLERDSDPVTVRIPTAHWLVQEMDSVQKEQKAVSCVSEKAKWWEGRRALDARMEVRLEMEGLLGCWRGLLLPLTSDPEGPSQKAMWCSFWTRSVSLALVLHTNTFSYPTLKSTLVCLARSTYKANNALSLCRGGLGRVLHDMNTLPVSVTIVVKPGVMCLVLLQYLQKLPWESISCLRPCSVTRMPSLHSLLGHSALKESDPGCVLNGGVDPKQVFYVLNPDANLGDTEERFKQSFTSEQHWQGVCGVAPDPDQLQDAVTAKDLYIYVGHGAGARFLDGQRILKKEMRAASLLFGCSSAALAVRGELEGTGIILNYLMAGCPLILGNLWDVTDRDIDRFTKALLDSWLSAGPGAPLLDHMALSRQATHLKHLIGAAPVVYGLPIHLR